jgi:hypothetical protein
MIWRRDPQFYRIVILTPLAIFGSLMMWWSLARVMPKWYDWPHFWLAGRQTSASVSSKHFQRYGKRDRYTRYTVTYAFRTLEQDRSEQAITATREVSRAIYEQLRQDELVIVWYDPADPSRSNIAGNYIVNPVGPLLFCLVFFTHVGIVLGLVGMGISKITRWRRALKSADDRSLKR